MKPLVLLAAAAAVLLPGCATADAGDDGRMPVTAAFYPLEFAAARVGGEHVRVSSLTKAGTEPHDLELTPKAVGSLARARAVVYLAGFQPAVDEAVRLQAADAAVDVSAAARLLPADGTHEGADDHDHAGETEAEHAGHTDPHFWLDPTRLADVASALGDDFARRDPANAADYRANASALVADLESLDTELATGLARCRSRELVTGHTAFGYLAARYDLHQQGVAGLSPEAEPTAAALRDLSEHVRDSGVTTVYTESLASPDLAETVAREAGATVAVLDPIEGLTTASAGRDYLEVMRADLATCAPGRVARDAGPPLVHLRGASFGYGERPVVSGVDLDLHGGEVVALLGPNGSGKSTLVRGILGLVDRQGGAVEIFGTPRERFTEHTRIGYVPQRHSLSASVRATVTEIVEVGRLPHRPWWRPASREDRATVREAIADVGLTDRAGEEVASLSGGQQRRVLIARALAGRPELLVMDEPTAGVDQANQEALAEVLNRLADRGTSMLVVTHELAALEGVVSRIVCLDGGHVDFDGTPTGYAAHLGHAPGSGHHHDDETPRGGPVLGAAPLDPAPRQVAP